MAKRTSNLTKFTAFQSEDEAIAMLERLRWGNNPACPHCGGADPYRLTPKATTKTRTQRGLWKCSQCRRKFTVKVGTIFESSHIPVSKWLMALHLISASKKGMSALQLQRMLGLTYRAAWFMAMRLRFAMSHGTFKKLDGVVEMDETYCGPRRIRGGREGRPGPDSPKTPVFALVQRGGEVRAFPTDRVTAQNIGEVLHTHVQPSTVLMTDELAAYSTPARGLAGHFTVSHSKKEYVRGNAHTNTVEGFFALLKRGIMGSFHHVSKQHLHRYCDEFAFRYNNRIALGIDDEQRTANIIRGAEGKRLTYR